MAVPVVVAVTTLTFVLIHLAPGDPIYLLAGVPVLLVNVEGNVHALRNECGDSPLPLHFGAREGWTVRCSWHGCRYDVRTGHRVDGQAGRVQVFPVAIDGGRVRVAMDVAPAAGEA
jgi:3-phenylpropionate/trans-cinnamate dioxygenase ferredoxin component